MLEIKTIARLATMENCAAIAHNLPLSMLICFPQLRSTPTTCHGYTINFTTPMYTRTAMVTLCGSSINGGNSIRSSKSSAKNRKTKLTQKDRVSEKSPRQCLSR